MKVRIKCSGLVVELADGLTIDRSFYEEIKDTQAIEQRQEVAKNKRGRKRKNNDNE